MKAYPAASTARDPQYAARPISARSRALAAICLALSCGCAGTDEAARPSAVGAEVNAHIATVVQVRWQTVEPAVGYVEYGPTEAMALRTPAEKEPATDHARTLLGLTADTLVHYRVVSGEGENRVASERSTIQTGPLPEALPTLTQDGEGHDRFTVVPILGSDDGGRPIVILDPQGQIVWYHIDDRGLEVYRARLSRDGQSVIYNAASISGDPAENSELVRVALDGSTTDAIPVPLLAHDFVELPDGTLGAIAVEYRDVDGEPLAGNKIVEIDPDGEITTVWSAWDCFDPTDPMQAGDTPELGWTFANALDYDAEEDAYYVGLRAFSSIVKIDRETGGCDWVLGLYGRTIGFASGSSPFLHQHQFDLRGDRLLVFDNEGSNDGDSRIIEYEIDFENNVAIERWRYSSDPGVYTFVLGEAQWLDDGGVFVNWCNGLMERLTPDGESFWRLESPLNVYFGFQTLATSLYPPDADTP